MRPASQRFFKQLYLSTNLDHILFSNFLGTNSLSVLMCRKAVNQSINRDRRSPFRLGAEQDQTQKVCVAIETAPASIGY